MANSIGKDKRPTSAARSTAASRLKATGAGASKPIAPKAPASVERDVAVAEAEDEAEELDMIPTDADELSELPELADDDGSDARAVTRAASGTVSRRATAPARPGFIGFVLHLLLRLPGARYVVASVQELRKVTAPTPGEAWNMTMIVVALSAVLAAILGAADLLLIQGLQWVVSLSK